MSLLTKQVNPTKRIMGFLIHAFTASGVLMGLLALYAIVNHQLTQAFWFMSASIVIDAVDGMFARTINIKKVVPEIDGALLDNIVDFFNYTIVPCFFLLTSNLLAEEWRMICLTAIIFSSSYQFTQVDAKTTDHFFKGFPSYWNIAVFYLFFWQLTSMSNVLILLCLSVLSFIPIKYIYPSRMDYLSDNKWLRVIMVFLTILWGISTMGLLWVYPESNYWLLGISQGYILLYLLISLYRTFNPLTSSLVVVTE